MKYTIKDFIEKKIAVTFKNEKERDEFLQMCEDNNLFWNSEKKATDYKPHYKIMIVFGIYGCKRLFYSNGISCGKVGYTIVPFSDFVKNNQSIHIYHNGKTTTAILKEGKKEIKRAEAKCSPEDEFDFLTGAEIALERLKQKKLKLQYCGSDIGIVGTPTKMKDQFGNQLYVGDVVYVEGGIYSEEFVCENEEKQFVMGIACDCKNNGEIDGWKVAKIKDYRDVKLGENYGRFSVIEG